MNRPIKILDVKPSIPEPLKFLTVLSNNVWFVWNHEAQELFRRMNQDLWEETRGNPVELLSRLKQEEFEGFSRDEGFLAHMERVKQEFHRYMSEKRNPDVFGVAAHPFSVAYFTAECGLADCLPIYSGGLGILSGDHLKSASDLNLPIVGVSLAYQRGYFRQYLSPDGWQMETYPINQFMMMPIELIKDKKDCPVTITLDLKGEEVRVQAWQVNVGRTRLILLDTNLRENSEGARAITAELYGGDREMRIRQEIILGIGGVRILRALDLDPAAFHMNEGHSAFTIFERIREMHQDKGLSFNEALELVRATSIFTTHTPVPAGIDTFHPDLMRTYFEDFARSMGISFDVLMAFGRQDPRNKDEEFGMAVIALRVCARNNGVSRLHGKVSRQMFQHIWPKTPEVDLPITHVTNGVHIPSWISYGMAENYNRYLGPRWIEDPDNIKVWERVDKIPNTELWRTHERARERLVAFTRKKLKLQLTKRGVPDRDLAVAEEVLNSEALTIGFARRFAPYKRASLILKDIRRLEKILNDQDRPVQMIFAGKAHPQDNMGKELIKLLVQTSMKDPFRRHMVFLEDYDMEIARYMVQGVDVWMNTPRRPLEACGTSGMKAVANGALHFSVLDGWWDEGYDRGLGWAIGSGEEYADPDFQDDLEGKAIYDILEKEIVPLFYDRGSDGLPRRWLAMVRASLHQLCPVFNTHRMVEDYWDRYCVPAAQAGFRLLEKEKAGLKKMTTWRDKIMYHWSEIAIKEIRIPDMSEVVIGTPFHMEADIQLGPLSPEDIVVEAYYGDLDPSDQFIDRMTCAMTPKKPLDDQTYQYQCDIQFAESGHFGINVRITPNHPHPASRHGMGLVIWGQ